MDKITVIPYASLNVGVTDYGTPIVRSVGQVAILMDQATQDPLPQRSRRCNLLVYKVL